MLFRSWETRRRRGPGHDWCLIRLGASGIIRRAEVDTTHFKGNYPESCSIEACDANGAAQAEILPRTRLQAHTRHVFEKEIQAAGPVTHVRFHIFPDGGIARLRLYGELQLRPIGEAELLACCGSKAWAARMARQQPFRHLRDLLESADRIWWDLSHENWLAAFRAHPRIGECAYAATAAAEVSQQEQAGTRTASEVTLAKLQAANHVYEAKFGHIFIVCATGKSAEEMLALLEQRLNNDPEAEIRVAAEEQRRITCLRLERLLKP